MRLHLPKALLAAVLAACLSWPAGAFTSNTTNYPTGSDTPTTFNGEIWTWKVTTPSNPNNAYENVSSANSEYTNYKTNDVLSGNTTNISGGPTNFYNYFFNSAETVYLGNTLRFTDDTALYHLRTDYENSAWVGGIIAESKTGASTYTLGRTDGKTHFKLDGANAVNMLIKADFKFLTNDLGSVTVQNGGTWSIAKGKSLTFDTKTTTISSGQNVNVTASGDGTGNASLTFSGAVTNNGILNIGSNVLFSASNTITNTGSITFSSGATINLDSFQPTSTTLNDSDTTGVQTWSGSWSLATGGTVTAGDGVIYQYKGKSTTGGSVSNGVISANGKYFNIISGDEKTYAEATADASINFINVLGRLTGISDSTTNYFIKGDGIIQVSGTLQYHEGTFLDDFTGTMEIGSGSFLKLGNTQNRLASLNLSRGTLTTTGANLEYSGAIIVTADSFLAPSGSGELTISGGITNQNNAGITSTGTVILSGAVTLGDLTVQSGSLNLGKVSGYAYDAKAISVGNVTVNAGATFSVGYTKGTVESVSLAKNATLRYYDNKTASITEASNTTTIKKLTVSAAATLQADWKGTLNISELTGAGNLALSKIYKANSPYFYLNISSIKDYSGTISGPTSNGSFMTVTIGEANISDAASTATVSANVTLKNGFTKTGAGAVSFGGTTTATDVTVSSGSLTFAGGTSISKLSLNGGSTTISGATAVSGLKENGIIAANDTIILTVSDTGTLTHEGFEYTGTELSGLSHGLTMLNANNENRDEKYNVTVNGGKLKQTDSGSKTIYAALQNVKLINTAGTTTLGVDANLSGASIGGTLQVEGNTTTTIKNSVTDSTDSTIATLTGSGTLKTTGGDMSVTNASGFRGTLESTNGTLRVGGSLSTFNALKATGGAVELQANAEGLSLNEVVVSSGSSVSAFTEDSQYVDYKVNNVNVGEGGGRLIGNLTINDKGTLTFDASAGTSGTGLALSYATTYAEGLITTTTGSLTLGSGLTLNLDKLGRLTKGDSLTLFSGVSSAVYGYGDNATELTADGIEANTVFSNLTAGDFKLSYSNNIVALVAQRDTPEPTTATLSLLALMALAARRRRKA